MRSRSDRLILTMALAVATFALVTPALAAETSSSEFVIIREDDVFPDDLYAGAVRILVEGTLEGDLVAFAAEEIVIDGNVTGSVLALAPSVVVTGEIGGTLRVVADRLEVTGSLTGDLVGPVRSALLGVGSAVGGDTLLWSWKTSALGTIGGDVTGSYGTLRLGGEVGGDVGVSVGSLHVVDPLMVTGDLGYRSEAQATGLEKATIGGVLVAEDPLPPNLRVRALVVLGRLLTVLFLTVAALIAVYGWPDRARMAIAGVGRSPVRRWLVGAVILFSPVLVGLVTALILGLAPAVAAFPLLAVLVPVILALLGIVFALSLVSGAPVVGWVGGVVFKKLDVYGAVLAGSVLAGIAWFVPLLGWLVPVIVLPLGLGGWLSAWRRPEPERGATGGGGTRR